MYGLVSAIVASGTTQIDTVVLVGLIVMGCIPTTISSNVVMTRAAKGNDSVSDLGSVLTKIGDIN